MVVAARLDLAAQVERFTAGRDWLTIAAFRTAWSTPVGASSAAIGAELRRIGFVPGFHFARAPRADLLDYENWLHRLVRLWCEGRPRLSIDQFSAAHPDVPTCAATRREIDWQLQRLGYRPAWVRLPG